MKNAIIWVIIVLGLAIGGYYFLFYGKNQESTTSNGNENISGLDEKTIPDAITNFYQKYASCLKNPPSEASGKVSEYCQNNTGLTTAAFAGNLEKGGIAKAGADPIFCAQSVPETKKTSSDFQMKNNKAAGFMVEKFGPNEIKPRIELVNDKGVWKVDNVVCPAPSPAVWEIIREKLAEKYNKPISEVNVSVTRSNASYAAGSVLFGQGGLGEGGLFLATKVGNDWQLVYDGNGSIDCKKMREQYKFSDEILKPNFCD